MIILDENFPESQRQLLRGWRVPLRQIGYEVGRKGMQDEKILPFGIIVVPNGVNRRSASPPGGHYV